MKGAELGQVCGGADAAVVEDGDCVEPQHSGEKRASDGRAAHDDDGSALCRVVVHGGQDVDFRRVPCPSGGCGGGNVWASDEAARAGRVRCAAHGARVEAPLRALGLAVGAQEVVARRQVHRLAQLHCLEANGALFAFQQER